jgi:DNA-binding transcriptional LysR family regulator
MSRDIYSDLQNFITVAQARSFTRAAAQQGVSQPTLSQNIRRLEEQLETSLFTRNARGVALTDNGQWLMENLATDFDEIEAELKSLSDLREEAEGFIRITAIDYAIRSIIWPKLQHFLPHYPKIKVELTNQYESVDIVAKGYDAGVRFGAELAQDMISVRIGPDFKNVVVGSQGYFSDRKRPKTPKDLVDHTCINLRTSTYGGIYEWEFAKDNREINAKVDGTVIFNNAYDILEAAKAGFGLAFLPEDMASPFIKNGQLVSVLEDWCPPWSGLHLYYPNRRFPSRAMTLLVDALRYKSEGDYSHV